MLFGPDSTASFLDDNNLDMVVRSHECVGEGFDLPFEGEMEGTSVEGISLLFSLRDCWGFFFFLFSRDTGQM